MKRRSAIAAGHALSCQVAREILDAGGNVVDAAIATHTAMFIAEPAMASGGGGGFATLKMKDDPVLFLDFFCHTPKKKRSREKVDIRPVTVDFGDEQELFYFGSGTIAVPGTLAGLFKMHELYGSIPIKILFQPAIDLMRSGVALDEFQSYDLSLLKDIFLSGSMGREIFAEEGQLKKEGGFIRMPVLADFLEVLAIEGKDLFYKGEAGKEFTELLEQEGGMINRTDLADYEVIVREPLSFKKGSWWLHTTPFPFLGGPLLSTILQNADIGQQSLDQRCAGLFETFLKVRPFEKDEKRLRDILKSGILPSPEGNGSTSHFSIVDEQGNAIALTSSIGEGSGIFLPSSGIHMNNMLGELALLPEGLHSWIPDVRLNSRMSPTIGENAKGDRIALGTGGAGRIPYVLAQWLHHFLHEPKHQPIHKITEYPRIYLDDQHVHIEEGLDASLLEGFDFEQKIKYWNKPSLFFGGVNAVALRADHLSATADHRRLGHTLID